MSLPFKTDHFYLQNYLQNYLHFYIKKLPITQKHDQTKYIYIYMYISNCKNHIKHSVPESSMIASKTNCEKKL